MSEAPTTGTRVLVKNHSEAPQGVFEAGTVSGEVATYIKPNESKVVTVDDTTLKHLRAHPTMFGVFDPPADPKSAEAVATSAPGQRADGDPRATEDQFDKMSDEELRAFLSDRGQKPHNFAGRPKLLIMARGPADAAEPAETV